MRQNCKDKHETHRLVQIWMNCCDSDAGMHPEKRFQSFEVLFGKYKANMFIQSLSWNVALVKV